MPDGEVVQLVTTTTEVELDFLKPHTSYSVVVAAGTRVGWGPFSSVLLFQTKESGELLPSNSQPVAKPISSHCAHMSRVHCNQYTG